VGHLVNLQLRSLGGLSSNEHPEDLQSPNRTVMAIRDSFVAESRLGFAVSKPLIASLSGRFKIGVVSNFYGNLASVLAEAGIAGSVQVMADSSRMALWKPDPGIFLKTLAQLGVEAHEVVMVGDSIRKDCVPARRLGMATVWLRHQEFVDRKLADMDAVNFTIDSLEELDDIKWLKG
jgi:FMN phosphatase YigB (HAD superfamily)